MGTKNTELKKLQSVQVEILDEIDKICRENNLNYFLIGGTLLGAVRHKGFIPWDDDLDIGMLRDDYEKFKELCLDKKQLNKKYFLHCFETDNDYWLSFMKVRKNNTTFGEKNIKILDTHKGIFVDIFPFDNVKHKKSFLQKVRAFLIITIVDAIYCKHKLRKVKACRRNLVVRILMLFSSKKLHTFQKKLLTINCNKNTNYIVSFVGGGSPIKGILEKNKVFPTVNLKFENREYPCPKDYDYYLKRVYGDYMKLPPEDQRITHEPDVISFTEGKNYENKRVIK